MIFNSFDFAIFFVAVFLIYWIAFGRSLRLQNIFLLVASYFFYGYWDYRFLSLILLSSVLDFLIGKLIHSATRQSHKKLYLITSLSGNLGILGVFKYYDFFAQSFESMVHVFGWNPGIVTLNLVLPVGISFYTFQTLSYTIDIYRGKIVPTSDIVSFFAYVSFFPQLVAGPIERAGDLLPQFMKKRQFNLHNIQTGSRLVLWGLLKKVVVADNLAPHVDFVFTNFSSLDGINIAIGAIFFAFQIYCDFSGYSDIAIGTARILGFTLSINFQTPYFSKNIADFWRRWHISLTSWFRDYLYIPLGGNRVSKIRIIINTLVTFGVCGLWHGANWTFIFWGLLNGLYFIPIILRGGKRVSNSSPINNGIMSNIASFAAMAKTFTIVVIGWIFFRSESLSEAFNLFQRLATHPFESMDYSRYTHAIIIVTVFILLEWIGRVNFQNRFGDLPIIIRYLAYCLGAIAIITLGSQSHIPFIYFQF